MDTLNYKNQTYDMALIATWIKYKRMALGYSQEYLAKGVCSVSHLSYFENGKKQLRQELVIALIERLDFVNLPKEMDLGSIRHQFYNMFQSAQMMDKDSAKDIFEKINKNRDLLLISPYAVEYKIFELFHNTTLLGLSLSEQMDDIESLEKILPRLSDDLKHVLSFTLGKLYYKFSDPEKGIELMRLSESMKRTAYTEYHLGFMYGFENQPLKGVYHLEKALKLYEDSGYYINAMWTNNYLGIFTNRLGDNSRAYKHYMSALNAANYFQIDSIKHNLYINLSHYYGELKDYENALKYSGLALELDLDPILAASNRSEVLVDTGRLDEARTLFDKYLSDQYKASRYYPLLRFNYLKIYHLKDDIFAEEVLDYILPHYETLHYVEIIKHIKLALIDHYESKRQYKKANQLYKEIIEH